LSGNGLERYHVVVDLRFAPALRCFLGNAFGDPACGDGVGGALSGLTGDSIC
jgi:hypothetical protein